MRKILFYKARSIYHDFIHAGLQNPALLEKTRRSVLRFNQFSLLNIFSGLIFFFLHGMSGFWKLSLIDLGAVGFFLMSFGLNRRHLPKSAFLVAFLTMNSWALMTGFNLGPTSGFPFLFLPQMVALIFLSSFKKWHLFLQAPLLVLLIHFLWAMFRWPPYSSLPSVENTDPDLLMNLHLFTSIGLTLIFILALVRVHWQYEQFLLEDKKLSDLVFHSSFDGVLVLKAATLTVKNCNLRAEELMETQEGKEKLTGLKFEQLLEDYYRGRIPWNQLRVEKKSWQGEMAFLTREGNIFPAYASFVPFEYKKNDFIKVSILDLSHLKNTEFELIRAKEDALMATNAKSRFLSHMSHEIRTPLTGIIESVRLILEEKNPAEKELLLLSLKELSHHLLQQVNDVLDFNKMEAGKLELDCKPIHLPQFAEHLLLRFAPQVKMKGLELVKEIDASLASIACLADEVRLNQVLGNLISNAIKFTPGGKIELKISRLQEDDKNLDMLFEVIDTGIGIAKEKQEQVFEAFAQETAETATNYGGSGLGLSIAKNLVASMSGSLKLESEQGRGSRFYFELNLQKASSDEAIVAEVGDLNPKELTVLLVDDHLVNRSVAERLLHKIGVQVVLAASGAEALCALETNNFDWVLTDLEMPEMNGIALLGCIKEQNRKMKVVAFSASVNETTRVELLKQGFDDVLCKPFRLQDLRDCFGRNLLKPV